MPQTSQKCNNFVIEPIGDKSVLELSGVGKTLGKRLERAGFDKAYSVLGQYLLLKKDELLFREWMKDLCKASNKQASDCYQCLHEWCHEFL